MADETQTTTMPLDHAYDALGDCVAQFYNHMLRQGVTALPPQEWAEEFRAWLDPRSFECEYERTKQWLAALNQKTEPAP